MLTEVLTRMSEPSVLASWTRALRKQLDALGLDSLALSRAAELDPQLMDDPSARYPVIVTTRLWQLAVEASADPALGLRVSRFVSPATFHALGYALVASASLREVFERIVSYHPVVENALELTLTRAGDRYEFRFQVPAGGPMPADEAMDAFAAMYLRTCRNRLGRQYAPLAVYLMRPTPIDAKPWHDLFRSPLFFNAEENMLAFACADFDSHLDDAHQPGSEHADSEAARSPDTLSPLTWERKVRSAIEAQLPEGEPAADRIAEHLHLGPRGLERHLADEGCRYDLVLNQCRQDLALQHMRDPDSSLSEVACLLGFVDTASFSRAFKRWTGLTPAQYRDGVLR